MDNGSESKEIPKEENIAAPVVPVVSTDSLRNIDLNAITNENDDKKASAEADASASVPEPDASLPEPPTESKHEEIPGWSLSDVDKMAIDSLQLAQLGRPLEEEEEDYDEEEG